MNDGGIVRTKLSDGVDDFVSLAQLEVLGGCDVHNNASSTVEVNAIKQGGSHRLLSSNACTVHACGLANAHHRLALFGHHCAYVGKVHIDQTGHVNDLGDPSNGIMQNIIGLFKSVLQACILVHHIEKLLIEHNDQGIHMLNQGVDAGFGNLHLADTLKIEGLGHHSNGENAHILGNRGYNRRGSRPCALAHAGC